MKRFSSDFPMDKIKCDTKYFHECEKKIFEIPFLFLKETRNFYKYERKILRAL